LSFAVDGKVAVHRSTSERRYVVKATIAEGIMRVTRMLRQTTQYRIKSAAAPALLLIEQTRLAGWTLTAPDPKTVELTAGAYRIPVKLGGDNEAMVEIAEERPLQETVRLADLNDDQLGLYVGSSELDPNLRRSLADLAARRQAVSRQRGDLERLKQRRAGLVDDESRLRDNLTALGREGALRKRVLDKLTETEAEIDSVSVAMTKAAAALAAAESELAAYVSALKP